MAPHQPSAGQYLRSDSGGSEAPMLAEGPGVGARGARGGRRCGPLWSSVAVMAILALQIASTTGLFVYFTMAISKLKAQAPASPEELRCLQVINQQQEGSSLEELITNQSCLKLANTIKAYVATVTEKVIGRSVVQGGQFPALGWVSPLLCPLQPCPFPGRSPAQLLQRLGGAGAAQSSREALGTPHPASPEPGPGWELQALWEPLSVLSPCPDPLGSQHHPLPPAEHHLPGGAAAGQSRREILRLFPDLFPLPQRRRPPLRPPARAVHQLEDVLQPAHPAPQRGGHQVLGPRGGLRAARPVPGGAV
ncbi:uncharacterized protein [Heliangelus exortis]|uniref:uncharacterized protein isoform X2 n=1 Tax=Heliangelus exortis TaxID=472823 RepID=UPI003A937F38